MGIFITPLWSEYIVSADQGGIFMDHFNVYSDIKARTGGEIYIGVVGPGRTGKSTFINQVAGRKTAKTEDRPGVTRSKQWVPIDKGLELLDTPGILWPKFEDQSIGLHLAYTGAVENVLISG